MPIYIVRLRRCRDCRVANHCCDAQTATALGKLGHPDGELNLTRAAAKHGVIQMVCLSYSHQGVVEDLMLRADSYACFMFFR